ncbi:hypothetical protein [Bacillus weihaiensis]|uniref:Uncharacterized protein n=1 Tax=Bacillus weihaiensis TaxID=1547283 RepID=A0A1L3MTK3_9BACI|nr:hypothetical protein [Bacillus weihaiensis]APH05665.1 hypothetical protein A9C19_13395 [Bacillus weihaiensis]
MTKEINKTLFIATFLLSCRVLSRSIEDAILVGLNNHCQERSLTFVEAAFYSTTNNKHLVIL